MCARDRGEAAIGEPHLLRGPGRGQKLQKDGDAFVVGNELADLETIAGLPAQGGRAQAVQQIGPKSRVDGSIWGELLATGISAPADKAERALLVTDLEFGEIAPPALGRLDLILLPLAGGRDDRHLDPTFVVDEAGRKHRGEPTAGDASGWPAEA
jgi:hypothetical protein